jgi:putative oxygen-independent coproporphyrinogen III oxidase
VLDDRARAEVPDTPWGVYVHVPWCARRCGYCAFTTYVLDDRDPAAVDAVHRRWADGVAAELGVADAELGPDRPPLTSIFVGGGTPTLVDPSLLGSVLDHVRRRFEAAPDLEVTVEANPDSVTPAATSASSAAGVTRMSFGMQSAVARVLELLDRTHDPERAPVAAAEARAAGIAHVSLDLIHGTPGETAADWARTLDAALAAPIDHLSAYALAIEPGTKLAARVRAGTLPPPSDDDAADRYETADAACGAAGLSWYELSNWAADDRARCRHNLLAWRDQHWWGVGPGAHSHVGGVRWWNDATVDAWAAAAHAGRVPAAGHEVPTPSQRRTERVLLGIRLAEGLPVETVEVPGGIPALVDDGLVEVRGGRIVLTRRGRLFADLVVRRLTP